MISFEGWNLIPIGLAIISIIFNIVQYVQRNKESKPIINSLTGLFNDIKTKSSLCYMKQNMLLSPKNPHEKLETLKWDFVDFLFSITQALQGFQEHIVSLLKGLGIKEGDVVKAIDFGLTDDEKEVKEEWWRQYKAKQKEGQKEVINP